MGASHVDNEPLQGDDALPAPVSDDDKPLTTLTGDKPTGKPKQTPKASKRVPKVAAVAPKSVTPGTVAADKVAPDTGAAGGKQQAKAKPSRKKQIMALVETQEDSDKENAAPGLLIHRKLTGPPLSLASYTVFEFCL